jgi:hypothetical protein
MNALFRTLLVSTLLGLSLVALSPSSSQADDYWDGYWGWYDNTYRPYYYRQYYYAPRYDYYGPAYPSYGYYDRYPGYRYRGNYYGTPNFGYRDFGGGGGQVRVGPLRFGWR